MTNFRSRLEIIELTSLIVDEAQYKQNTTAKAQTEHSLDGLKYLNQFPLIQT